MRHWQNQQSGHHPSRPSRCGVLGRRWSIEVETAGEWSTARDFCPATAQVVVVVSPPTRTLRLTVPQCSWVVVEKRKTGPCIALRGPHPAIKASYGVEGGR